MIVGFYCCGLFVFKVLEVDNEKVLWLIDWKMLWDWGGIKGKGVGNEERVWK